MFVFSIRKGLHLFRDRHDCSAVGAPDQMLVSGGPGLGQVDAGLTEPGTTTGLIDGNMITTVPTSFPLLDLTGSICRPVDLAELRILEVVDVDHAHIVDSEAPFGC